MGPGLMLRLTTVCKLRLKNPVNFVPQKLGNPQCDSRLILGAIVLALA